MDFLLLQYRDEHLRPRRRVVSLDNHSWITYGDLAEQAQVRTGIARASSFTTGLVRWPMPRAGRTSPFSAR